MYIKNIRTGPPTGINVSIFWKKKKTEREAGVERERQREREREINHNAGTYLKNLLLLYFLFPYIQCYRKKLKQVDCYRFIFTRKYISYMAPVRMFYGLYEVIYLTYLYVNWTLK